MKLEFLTASDPRWMSFLDRVEHRLDHLPGYANLWAKRDGGAAEAVLMTHGDDYFFVPYVLNSLPGEDGLLDLRSPYGYPGPLVRAESPQFLTRAMRRWCDAMGLRGVVSGFIRFDPLAPEHSPELNDFGRLCLRGDTVALDLTADEATLRGQMRKTMRKQAAHAARAGLRVNLNFGAAAPLERFHAVYWETMQRVAAARDYYYAVEHLQGLAELLPDGCGVGFAENAAGVGLSGGLFLEYCGVVQHHLQGTTSLGLRLNAAKLLVFAMIHVFQARGNRIVHLGGGRGGAADGLLQFKGGFSRNRRPFFTWHLAFLPGEFRRLVAARRTLPAPVSPVGYFPEYRSAGDLSS